MILYFNEIDAYAAAWLKNLWPDAIIDQRSITDVQAKDLADFRRCHFFGGIGGWEYALKLAGWPEEWPVWTGSPPCQPFSSAGKGKGEKDERHLWPEFRRLIAECHPPVIFGEQVASRAGRDWYSGVRSDLEALGYAVGCADLCAASAGEKAEGRIVRGDQISYERIIVGAPHIRQRLFWVAKSQHAERRQIVTEKRTRPKRQTETPGRLCKNGHSRVGNAVSTGSQGCGGSIREQSVDCGSREPPGEPGGSLAVDQPESIGDRARPISGSDQESSEERRQQSAGGRSPYDFWSDFGIVHCTDSKSRRIEPRTFPLAHGVPDRVGKLRAYGNAIVPQVAAIFIKAFMETL